MKTYFRGLLTGLIIGASSILFMGSKFGGFKSINDVYDLMVTVQYTVGEAIETNTYGDVIKYHKETGYEMEPSP